MQRCIFFGSYAHMYSNIALTAGIVGNVLFFDLLEMAWNLEMVRAPEKSEDPAVDTRGASPNPTLELFKIFYLTL